jgi:hypothetical protein
MGPPIFPTLVTLGPQQRLVTLFQGGPPHVVAAGSPMLRLGYGRATQRMPLGESDNANIIDSPENKLNYRAFAAPQTFRDVVWHLSNSKQTDELVFDDALDPDAVVVANMTGLLTLPPPPPPGNVNSLVHHSGWNASPPGFTNAVKLQNGATTLSWQVPPHGLVTGPGRLEPAATGGIHGKGFWMDGGIGIDFAMPAQSPGKVARSDWYFGLFVDCRFADDATERRLVTFPDHTSVRLLGRRQVLYADANDAIVARITLPAVDAVPPASAFDDLLPHGGWAHLAFQVRRSGRHVEMLLDGLPFSHWQHATTALFQPTAGSLTLGKAAASAQPGFRGWIDDFKLLAHTVDPETACNHAGGTLIGLPAAYAGVFKTKFADRFPAWTHAQLSAELRNRGETAHPAYANFIDYQHDLGATAGTMPAGTAHLRQAVHFPEGPLFHDAPRPDTRQNAFCISCHSSAGQAGLGLSALAYTGVPATFDPRRQPAQPPAQLFGQVPAGLVEGAAGSQPATATTTPPGGLPIDPWMLPSHVGPSSVQTFTVLHPSTGKPLAELRNGDVVDPARLGTAALRFAANLDTAQGSVLLELDAAQLVPVTSPYVIPTTPGGITLSPGAHLLRATPNGGAPVTADFTVAGASIRTIAGTAADFQGGSPDNGWIYCWNENGAVNVPSGYRHLSWHAASGRYTSLGLAFPEASAEGPFVSLNASGGHPGRGTAQGAAADRYVIAGYRARIAGYYGLQGSFDVTSGGGNGIKVVVYVQTGGAMTLKWQGMLPPGLAMFLLPVSLGQLAANDMIWIGAGPNGDDTSDSFQWTLNVRYWEQAF